MIGSTGRRHLPLFLADTGVYSNGWKVALSKKLVKLGGSKSALDEDDDLIELKAVEEIVELAVLLRLVELDTVLLKTVQRELSLVIDVDLERISHKFLADWSDLL